MSKTDKYLKGAFLLSLSAVAVKIFGVLFKIPLSYILTDEGMGYFNSAYTVYGFFYIISSAGIPKAVSIVLGESEEENGMKNRAVLKGALRFFGITGFLLFLLFLISAPFLSSIIGNHNALYSMIATAPSLFFISFSGVCKGYLNYEQRHFPVALSQITEAGLKLIVGISLAYLGKQRGASFQVIAALAILGLTIGSLFSSVILLIATKSREKDFNSRQNFNLFNKIDNRRNLKKILKIALPITLTASISNVSCVVDLGIIMRQLQRGGLSEAAASALYGNYSTLALSMFNLVVSIVTPLSVTALPVLVSHRREENREAFLLTLSRSVLFSNLIASFCSVAFYLYSFEILDVLFSSYASSLGTFLLSIISPALVFLSSLTMLNTAHESMGNFKYSVISLVVTSFSKIVASYVFTSVFSFGIAGAAFSTVISYLAGFLTSYIFILKEKVNVSLRETVIIPLLLSVVSHFPFYMLLYKNGILGYNVATLFILLAASFALFLILTLLIYGKRINAPLLLTKLTKNEKHYN